MRQHGFPDARVCHELVRGPEARSPPPCGEGSRKGICANFQRALSKIAARRRIDDRLSGSQN
jgi:hypothetical protein